MTTSVGGLVAGRYQMTRVLKEGTGCATFLAEDVKTAALVVVRTFPAAAIPPGALALAEADARALSQIASPYLAPLLDFGTEQDEVYAVSPFVPGAALEARLSGGPLSLAEVLTVAENIASALTEAHEAGVIHRHVTSASVIIDPATPVRRAVLIDLGLGFRACLRAFDENRREVDVRYMSPEQAGLVRGNLDPRSDLYSVGVLLFRCLAGRYPFEGTDVKEVLRQHLSTPAPSLRRLGISVPRALEEIVGRLLHKNPSDRYQTAAGLVSDLKHLTAAIRSGSEEPDLVVGASDRREILGRPALIGRNCELAELSRHLTMTVQGQGHLVLLEGRSGGGKTRLLDELARLAEPEVWVLRGGGLGLTASRPLEVLTGVVQDVLDAASSDPAIARSLCDRLAEIAGPLCEVLPQLHAIFGTAGNAPVGPAEYGPGRSLRALTAFLDALGSAARPAIVLLDDCQWIDELSAQLLEWWSGEPVDQRLRHVMVVAASRMEEVGPLGGLSLPGAAHLTLHPLAGHAIRQLARSMGGPLPEQALQRVEQLAEGNPFMAVAVLEGFVECGALSAASEGWEFDEGAQLHPQSSLEAGVVLACRLDALSAGTQHLLCAGAVLSREFDLERAGRLVGQSPNQALANAREAQERHLVWVSDTTATFVHDRIREAVLSRIDDDRRTPLHQAAAADIEATGGLGRSFDLAFHYHAAGLVDAAFPHALAAAEQARARHTLEIAEQLYRIAEAGSEAAGDQGRVAEALGQVLMLRGRYDEAGGRFQLAYSLARTDMDRARLEGQLGDLAFKRGLAVEASRRIVRALGLLGERVPQRSGVIRLLLTREIAVQFIPAGARRFPGRRSADADRDRLKVYLYARLLYAWWFHRSTVAVAWSHFRLLNVARRSPPGEEQGHAYAVHGAALSASFPCFYRRGFWAADRALAIQQNAGDLWGQGQALGFRAIVEQAALRFSAAVATSDRSMELLERAGDPWEFNTAAWHRGLALYRSGDLGEAAAQGRSLHEAGLRLGDTQSAGIGLWIWAKSVRGRIPGEPIAALLRAGALDTETRAMLLEAEGIRLLAAGRPDEAAAALEMAKRTASDAGLHNMYVAPILPWLASARRERVEAASALAPRRRRRLLREARRSASRALLSARLYRDNLPHALREAALAAALAGRTRRARRLLEKSLAVAERQGARAEHAETLCAKGRVGSALGWPGADQEMQRGAATQRALLPPEVGTAEPFVGTGPALADRFAALLDAGRRLAFASSAAEVVDAVREIAQTLLRAEDCFVYRVTTRGDTILIPGDPTRTPLGYLGVRFATQTVAEGRPLMFAPPGEAGPAMPGDELVVAGVCSALSVPVMVAGVPEMCFVATHRHVRGLFGQEEERLASFVAALAGAAIQRTRVQLEIRKQVVAAQESERGRLARDLHDQIGQTLTSALLGLRLLKASPADEALVQAIDDVHALTVTALADARRLAFELRPTMLDDLGLVAGLQRLGDDLASRHPVDIHVNVDALSTCGRLRPDLETAIYRITQEALTNVVRHSRAHSASVLVTRMPGRLRLVIEDDGQGFDTQTARRSFGLHGMRERAVLVDGTLELSSGPTGTSVVFEVSD